MNTIKLKTGETVPTSEDLSPNEVGISTSTHKLYQGHEIGEPTVVGVEIHSGVGAPANTLGKNGDLYIEIEEF